VVSGRLPQAESGDAGGTRCGDGLPDVVCLGETMAMVTPDPPCPLDVARSLALSHGGSESNVAVWLARLGSPAAWCSRLGDDVLGHRVMAEIAAAGVGTDLVALARGARTGVYFKDPRPGATNVIYYRNGSAAAGMDERDVDRALARPPRILHLTGITPALSDSCADAVDYAITRASELGVIVSFDINYRPSLWPGATTAATALRRLARRCHIVFVGSDEAEVLWRVPDVRDLHSILDGARVLVVKDGSRSASSVEETRVTSVPALPAQVVEPVGAGDAFAAGWLHGWLRDLSPEARLRLGHLVASAALTSATDHGEFPVPPGRLEEMARRGNAWPPPDQMRPAGEH
jgi:2-dehydro-3-deoxygluconokinase